MIVRVGLPKTTGALPGVVEWIGAPALVSAMSMWDKKRRQFRQPGQAIDNVDCALDSAGFVAMERFGGYPWTVAQYAELAGLHSWDWWASMDYCCEPQIASDREEVTTRVWATALTLGHLRAQVEAWLPECPWLTQPMPILQGWAPDDYERSVELTGGVLDDQWPAMVGLGSVCRRHLGGSTGIAAVLGRLDRILPVGVGLHLFGVKGSALHQLADHPRVVSTDSQAWGTAARRKAHAQGSPCTIGLKKTELIRWREAQAPPPTPQQALFGKRAR